MPHKKSAVSPSGFYRPEGAPSLLLIAYMSTPAATDTLSESMCPYCGMDRAPSHRSLRSRETPEPSAPRTSAIYRLPTHVGSPGPEPCLLELLDGACEVGHGCDRHVRDSAGRRACDGVRFLGRAALGHNDEVRSEYIGGTDYRAEVVRVLDVVQYDDEGLFRHAFTQPLFQVEIGSRRVAGEFDGGAAVVRSKRVEFPGGHCPGAHPCLFRKFGNFLAAATSRVASLPEPERTSSSIAWKPVM